MAALGGAAAARQQSVLSTARHADPHAPVLAASDRDDEPEARAPL